MGTFPLISIDVYDGANRTARSNQLIFAILRPRFRQVYSTREWFPPQEYVNPYFPVIALTQITLLMQTPPSAAQQQALGFLVSTCPIRSIPPG